MFCPQEKVLNWKFKIVKPTDKDILSGRGTHVYHHHGNIHFMQLVKKYQARYETCPKAIKKVHAKEIYSIIRSQSPPGRFLKPCSSDKSGHAWIELDYKSTILKIRQAMRDNELRESKIKRTLQIHARKYDMGKSMELRIKLHAANA